MNSSAKENGIPETKRLIGSIERVAGQLVEISNAQGKNDRYRGMENDMRESIKHLLIALG